MAASIIPSQSLLFAHVSLALINEVDVDKMQEIGDRSNRASR